ncbi:ORF83 [Agrotis segetum granulovirus]|uniref:ORF83 n=1 Tax=Agrotis segetum granulosis virus TaxID=10464 RepID=Q6QXM3_GVAS|nr:p33 [Agrotis segetum granulovirus]AAS82655.1 ORF83 [Agrotis segetum granulovirus]AKN63371.1 p33 [Agrotis segetum granulovirus]
MLVETPTVIRYKGSCALFIYRMLDMTRVAPSKELQSVLIKEVRFLYHLFCVTVYGDPRAENVEKLISWCVSLGKDVKLDNFKDMYTEALLNFNLENITPPQFMFSFSTIWDSIHFICLIADEMVVNRDSLDIDMVRENIKNIKWIFYNIFIVLFCPMCAKHFLTINSFPYEVEKVEVALYNEKMGDPLTLVQEYNRSMSTKNVLYTNHLVYESMLFHNHVNSYRPIQQNNDKLNKFQKMDWTLYKKLLGIIN